MCIVVYFNKILQESRSVSLLFVPICAGCIVSDLVTIMEKRPQILSKAFDQFTKKYSELGYTLNQLQLWSLSELEYADSYICAATELGIDTPLKPTVLEKTAKEFCAELLRTPHRGIILMNENLICLGEEVTRITAHELGHALCYKANLATRRLAPQGLSKWDEFCLLYGQQVWNEYVAEWMAYVSTGYYAVKSRAQLQKEFKSLMFDISLFPQRMGFFLFDCHQYGCDISEITEISKGSGSEEALLCLLENIMKLLQNKTVQRRFWIDDKDFLKNLGQAIAIFAYYYLAFYNHTEIFLKDEL